MISNFKQKNTWPVLLIIIGLIISFFIINGTDLFRTSERTDLFQEDVSSSKNNVINIIKDSIPSYVRNTYNYIQKHGDAPSGYYGGRSFQNREKKLPSREKNGENIFYREWDVHPRQDGIDRGAERLVTGSDGSAWYTNDHYRSFLLIEKIKHGKRPRY